MYSMHISIQVQASNISSQIANSTTSELVAQTTELTMQLAVLTEPNATSLLPSSLGTTNVVLTIVIDVLEGAENSTRAANEVTFESCIVILDKLQIICKFDFIPFS